MLSPLEITRCDFVAVDLETTGCTPGRNSIIEIGAVRTRPDGTTSEFSTLVRPQDTLPRAIVQLTGITPEMLLSAPAVDEAVAAFRTFAQDAVLVAHNYRFDLGFLDHEGERLWGAPFPRPAIDTLAMARRLYPRLERYSLLHLSTHLGVTARPDHRALNDARAAAQVLAVMLPGLQEQGIRTVGALAEYCGLSHQTALASRLPLTRDLPDAPGVYLFRDETGRVIFVGRAKSLRGRIRSHFYPPGDRDHSPLGSRVMSLRALATESSLDAALLERRLIARNDPTFNAVSQRPRALYTIRVQGDTPFPGVQVTTQPRRTGTHIGPFTSRWAANTLAERLAEVYGLRRCCHRLGPALAARECPHRDAGCPAPCVNDVDPVDYTSRVRQFVSALGLGADDARERLTALQALAAADTRYEDAIRYRDGLRALDRGLGTLGAIRSAASHDAILVEHHDRGVTVHLIRGGLRAAVLRGAPSSVAERLPRTLQRVYYHGAAETRDPLSMTPEEVAQLLVIGTFMATDDHATIPVADSALTLAAVRRSLGLDRRQPRRRHAVG